MHPAGAMHHAAACQGTLSSRRLPHMVVACDACFHLSRSRGGLSSAVSSGSNDASVRKSPHVIPQPRVVALSQKSGGGRMACCRAFQPPNVAGDGCRGDTLVTVQPLRSSGMTRRCSNAIQRPTHTRGATSASNVPSTCRRAPLCPAYSSSFLGNISVRNGVVKHRVVGNRGEVNLTDGQEERWLGTEGGLASKGGRQPGSDCKHDLRARAESGSTRSGRGPSQSRRRATVVTTTGTTEELQSPSSKIRIEYLVIGIGGAVCVAFLYALTKGLMKILGGGGKGRGKGAGGSEGSDGDLGNVDMPQAVKEKKWRSESMASLKSMASEMRAKRVVDLNGRNLGDEGITYLAESLALNRVAARVDLSSNGIGLDGFKALSFALSENDFVEYLNVSGNRCGDEGAAELAKVLDKHRSIQHLDLSSNNIGNDGAVALASILKKSTSIEKLELNNNEIDYDGFVALGSALAENSSIKAIHLNGNYAGSLGAAALAKGFAENTSLKELHLNGNGIGDEGIRVLVTEGLATHKGKITTIDLGNNSIGSKGAHYIASFVKKSKSVQWLNLYMNDISDKGAERMGDALRKNKSLSTIDLGGNNIHADGMKHIAEALKENKTLTTLELGYNPIGPEGAKLLSDVVKFHGNVETLRLGWCKIGVKGAEYMADALRYNATITTLDLRANSLGDDGAVALARSLRVVNETLGTLDLGFNEIRDKGAYALAEALKANGQAAVSTLNLSSNYLTKYGVVALSEARDIISEMNDGKEVNILW